MTKQTYTPNDCISRQAVRELVLRWRQGDLPRKISETWGEALMNAVEALPGKEQE